MSFYDDASLILLAGAAAGKDGKAYSVKPTDGNGDFTFSRGSNLSATRVGPDGLIEKGRENVMRYSNQFTVSGRYSTSASTIELASNEIGYNGNSDVWELAENDATTSHWIRDNQDSITGVGTISVYAKYNGRHLQLRPTGIGSGVAYANFDLISGVKGTSDGPGYIDSTITRVGDTDWYRCSLTINHSGNYSWLAILVDSTSATELPSYPGDGTSGIYMQYAQLEIGLTATEYIESGASTGKAGLLEDEPRFDYSGGATCPSLLLEPQRSNLITQSEYLNGISWNGKIGTSFDTNTTTSPEGLGNSALLKENSSNGSHFAYKDFNLTSGSTYTISIFAKSNGANRNLRFGDGGVGWSSGFNGVFDLTAGTATGGIIESMGSGWYRCSVTGTTNATTSRLIAYATLGGATSYQGDGASGVFLYGFQIEEGSYPTSYIPNHSGGTITRGADFNSNNDIISTPISFGANDDFTLYYEGSFDKSGSQGMIMGGGGVGAAADTKGYWWVRSSDLYLAGDAETTIATASFSVVANTNYKLLVKRNGSVLDFFANGTKLTTNQVNPNTGFTFRSLGWSYSNAVYKISGDIKQALIFPTALSDADCITLTGTSYDTFADMAEALNYTVYE